ncbi:MAG: response regulator [Chlamydiae bacterium]|nr:response regulator [Chlamydiota bacterium]MBI3266801.1 response regulator [Chlamydiota bacterium]
MESHQKTVLVVDDEESIRESLKMILADRYKILTASSAENALQFLQQNSQDVDVIFSDILMLQMNGIQLLEAIKKSHPNSETIIMTAYPTLDTTLAALKLGASDYILKPFAVDEILEATRRAVERKKTVVRNQEKIRELTTAIQRNYEGTTRALISAINARDQYTGGHSNRVSKMMGRFAKFLNLDPEVSEKLEVISYLHDIGKIGVSQEILNKTEELTPEEYEEVKLHPFIGYKILQPVDFLNDCLDVMLYHQERFDGKGYPAGLKDYEIPLGARMLGIVDAYDAMTSTRPYRKKLTQETAFRELKAEAGSQFDPELVESFIKMVSQVGEPVVAKTA